MKKSSSKRFNESRSSSKQITNCQQTESNENFNSRKSQNQHDQQLNRFYLPTYCKKEIEDFLKSDIWNFKFQNERTSNFSEYLRFIQSFQINLNQQIIKNLLLFNDYINERYQVASLFILQQKWNYAVKKFMKKVGIRRKSYLNFQELPLFYFLTYKYFILPFQIQNQANQDFLFALTEKFQQGFLKKQNYLNIKALHIQNNFAYSNGFNLNILSTNNIQRQYGSLYVDIIKQGPIQKIQKYNEGEETMQKMLLKSFLQVFRSYQNPEQGEYREFLSVPMISINDNKKFLETITKSLYNHQKFYFLGKNDLLSYSNSPIQQYGFPKLELLASGAWKGSCLQNLETVALNIGTGKLELMSLPEQNIRNLIKDLQVAFNIDIEQSSGMLYCDEDFFKLRGHPIIKKIVQPGDLFFCSAGSMTWLQAIGNCTLVKWSILPKLQSFLLQFLQKQKQQTIYPLPLKTLTLKYINHQYHYLANSSICQLIILIKEWIGQEASFIEKDSSYKLVVKPLLDSDTFCSECFSEIFLYYKKIKGKLCCLCCGTISLKNSRSELLYQKYKIQDIQELLNLMEEFQKNRYARQIPEVVGLCDGVFLGEIQYCYKIKRCGTKRYYGQMFSQSTQSLSSQQRVSNFQQTPKMQGQSGSKSPYFNKNNVSMELEKKNQFKKTDIQHEINRLLNQKQKFIDDSLEQSKSS